jgi:DNA-binding transcriptional LysR family regulator
MRKIAEQLQRTRFDELAVLVAVAEVGSLTGAAKQLGVPKSTVGRAIRRLEEDLGVALARRMARGQALTEPGRLLAQLSAPHVAALRDVTAALGRDAAEAYGLLRVTAPPDIGALVLGPLLAGFLARHPRVQIEVEHTLRLVDLVREGVDLAIRIAIGPRLPPSTLVARKLTKMNIALYASAAYAAGRELPEHPDELAAHDRVFHTAVRTPFALEGPRGVVKVSLQGRIGGNDFVFVRELIASGAGIGPLPWFLASPEVASGRLVRVLPQYRAAGLTAHLVYPPAQPVPPKVIAFCAYLHEHAPRLMVPPF